MVTNNESNMRECPFCKEEILAEAIKCKHCGSAVASEAPAHEGTCPFCKETINPEAIKCKHCKSMLGQAELPQQGRSGCGCGGMEPKPGQETNSMMAMRRPEIGVSGGSWCWASCYGLCRLGGGPHYECNLGCDLLCGTGTVVANNPFNVMSKI